MVQRPMDSATVSRTPQTARPRRQLSVWHAVAVCVGMVIGSGIFKATPSAAANAGSPEELLLLWVFGGLISLIGALCFAELSSAFPDAGGDYYFLRRAYGEQMGFLFAWSRFAVIHTGSMALLAFVFADYVNELVQLGTWGSAALAASLIVLLAAVNLVGIRFGVDTQVGLMLLVLSGLLSVGIAGIWVAVNDIPPAAVVPGESPVVPQSVVGAALIYVFLAYGGWSDAATLSAEMKDERRGIQRALIIGIGIVTSLYLFANWAFLRGLGHAGFANSSAPAADLMLHVFGRTGQVAIIAVVAITSITVINALMIAGARTTYAAARDVEAKGLARLSGWHEERGTPYGAIIAMSVAALLLVAFGAITRGGFSTMVDYLTPVYWLFLALSGIAVIVLRYKHPEIARPFRVPFFPILPLVFIASSLYVFYSSLIYVRVGALTGIGVLAVGYALYWVLKLANRN
jgi:basic amino acid/polyamine antiporter, APA family